MERVQLREMPSKIGNLRFGVAALAAAEFGYTVPVYATYVSHTYTGTYVEWWSQDGTPLGRHTLCGSLNGAPLPRRPEPGALFSVNDGEMMCFLYSESCLLGQDSSWYFRRP